MGGGDTETGTESNIRDSINGVSIFSIKTMSMEKLLSIGELSEKLGIPIATLYAWTCKKKIPYIKLGTLVRFKESEITEWISKKSVLPDEKSFTPVSHQKRRRRSSRQGTNYIDRIVQTSKEAVFGIRRGV